MTCTIDHSLPGTFPAFLCRGCNPDQFKVVSIAPRLPTAPIPAEPIIQSYRNRYPLTDKDKAAIAELKELERSRLVEVDGQLTEVVVMRRPGIIAIVIEMMQRPEGASRAEMVAELVQKFPDREERGMRSTVGIQSNKLATRTEEIEGRGRVFYMVVES